MLNGSNVANTTRSKLSARRLLAWIRRATVLYFWWLLLLIIFLLALTTTYIRKIIPSFEPLTNEIFAKHPILGGTCALLIGIAPDITSIMLGVLGLTYLFPRTVRRISRFRHHRLGLVVLIVTCCLATIIFNQINREKQDQWQTSVSGGITNIQTVKPNWVDKALQQLNLPSRIVPNVALPPKQPQQQSVQVSPVISKPEPSAPLTATEIAMIRETATASATGIQQDYDKLQSQADERYRKIRQNTVDSFVQTGHYTKEQAEQLANGMNTPSVASQKAQESAAYGRVAYGTHQDAVQALINLASAHQSDIHRELISRILELRQACFIDRAPGQVQACISKLKDVATEAK